MKLFAAPETVPATCQQPRVFLAGAIEKGSTRRWQDDAVAAFAKLPGSILNPRRDDWDATWGTGLDDPRFAQQVQWELGGLELADLILCWLPATSQAPISLLELGLHARRGTLLVGCQPAFYRYGNVAAVCQRYGIPLYSTWDELLQAGHQRLTLATAMRTSR
jgi:hypothetical protein